MPGDTALVVGLGNPGAQYARTRHNAGFRVIDILAARLGVGLRAPRGMRGMAGEGRDGDRRLVLVQPMTYMNLSGESVQAFARYHKVEPEDIVVVHDDLDLPLGVLRVKRGGGDGGHNGLASISRALGSKEYARVRIGIDRPPGRQDPAEYVLQPFGKRGEETIGVVLQEAADAALIVIHEGVGTAQNRYNGPPGGSGSGGAQGGSGAPGGSGDGGASDG